ITLLARAKALWGEALHPLGPRAETVRAAAVLSLLRWAPAVLHGGDNNAWRALLDSIAGGIPREQPPPTGDPRWTSLAPEAFRAPEKATEPIRGETGNSTGRVEAVSPLQADPSSTPDASRRGIPDALAPPAPNAPALPNFEVPMQ